jgi:nucleotidyltransferase DUF2204
MLNPDFRDILSAFIAEGVEFLVVGAYALAVHGIARATGDLDLWIRAAPENAERVWRALATFGSPLEDFGIGDLAAPDNVLQIGRAPTRIDLLTSIDAVEFEEAAGVRLTVAIDGLTIPVIGREHRIRNKRAVGRPQDLADVARLEGG